MTLFTENDFNRIALAQEQFKQKKYDKCIESLEQLEKSSGRHLKIVHNKQIAEFYKNDLKTVKELLHYLENDIDIINSNQQSECIAQYNLAVIYFHQKRYDKAIDILISLTDCFDNLCETTSGKIGLLLLHIFVVMNEIRKAEKFYQYLTCKMNFHFLKEDELDLSTSSGSSDKITMHFDEDIRSMAQLLKYRLSVLTEPEDFHLPDEEIKSLEYQVLKAFSCYLKKDYHVAARLLINRDTDLPLYNIILGNNMGIIHMMSGNYGKAEQFFQKAIQHDKELSKNIRDAPLIEMSQTKTAEILYNMGLAKLHMQQFKDAFDCLLVTLRVYNRNPRLWLRAAECCIQQHRLQKDVGGSHQIKFHGNKKYHIVNTKTPVFYSAEDGSSRAIPVPNIAFASLCLSNALSLAQQCNDRLNDNSDDEDDSWKSDNHLCNSSYIINQKSQEKLLVSIYANSSYVALEMGDYCTALKHAEHLLKISTSDKQMQLLGRLYAGKSLVYLNNTMEAQKYFAVENHITGKTADENQLLEKNRKNFMLASQLVELLLEINNQKYRLYEHFSLIL